MTVMENSHLLKMVGANFFFSQQFSLRLFFKFYLCTLESNIASHQNNLVQELGFLSSAFKNCSILYITASVIYVVLDLQLVAKWPVNITMAPTTKYHFSEITASTTVMWPHFWCLAASLHLCPFAVRCGHVTMIHDGFSETTVYFQFSAKSVSWWTTG